MGVRSDDVDKAARAKTGDALAELSLSGELVDAAAAGASEPSVPIVEHT